MDDKRDKLTQIHYQLVDLVNLNVQCINAGRVSNEQATTMRLKLNWVADRIDEIKG